MKTPCAHRDFTVTTRCFAAFVAGFAGDSYAAAMVESFDSRRAS
jgi:hypothetical protein